MSVFIELLQVALRSRECLSRIPDVAEWELIYDEAERQAVLGIMLDGLERLPQEQLPPVILKLQWIGAARMVEAVTQQNKARSKELSANVKVVGFNSCVLKGVAIARYYPTPMRRQCGDIDLWAFGRRKDVMARLKRDYSIEHNVWHHVGVRMFEDVPVEIHFHPAWLYNPLCNWRLQRWLNRAGSWGDKQNDGYNVMPVKFDAVFSLLHTYRHLLAEGIGIRHIVDYYYILKALPAEDRTDVVEDLKRFGMMKLAKAMMWVQREVCGARDGLLLCEPNEKEGRFLLDEIMRGGNFGHYRKDNRKRNSVARMCALLPHYPREVLWMVPWKLWHKGWRMVNS